MEALTILLFGFLLGMRHSTDSDHVVAVTTFVSQQKSIGFAAKIGAVWGLGHTLTICLVGIAIIFFDFTVTPRLGLTLEFMVGIMIVVLGLLSLRIFLRKDSFSSLIDRSKKSNKLFRPLIVGLVHGLAGSAAVAVLIMNTISNEKTVIIYMLLFGLGTVIGMMVLTLLISLPYVYSQKIKSTNKILGTGTSILSIAFGLFIMYQVGFQDGLFSTNPSWIP